MDKTIYTKEHQKIVVNLKKARKEANLTQIQVARKLKKPQSFISKYESGQCRIDIVQLKRFARIYKKDLGFFIK